MKRPNNIEKALEHIVETAHNWGRPLSKEERELSRLMGDYLKMESPPEVELSCHAAMQGLDGIAYSTVLRKENIFSIYRGPEDEGLSSGGWSANKTPYITRETPYTPDQAYEFLQLPENGPLLREKLRATLREARRRTP